jgi:hypothetical protein
MEASTTPQAQATPSTVTVTLTQAEQEALHELARLRGISPEVVLREALLEKKFLADNRRAGRQIVLREPDGKLIPINWSYEY